MEVTNVFMGRVTWIVLVRWTYKISDRIHTKQQKKKNLVQCTAVKCAAVKPRCYCYNFTWNSVPFTRTDQPWFSIDCLLLVIIFFLLLMRCFHAKYMRCSCMWCYFKLLLYILLLFLWMAISISFHQNKTKTKTLTARLQDVTVDVLHAHSPILMYIICNIIICQHIAYTVHSTPHLCR